MSGLGLHKSAFFGGVGGAAGFRVLILLRLAQERSGESLGLLKV